MALSFFQRLDGTALKLATVQLHRPPHAPLGTQSPHGTPLAPWQDLRHLLQFMIKWICLVIVLFATYVLVLWK